MGGRFAVRDQKTTLAVGVVQHVDPLPDQPWVGSSTPPMRCKTPKSTKAHSRHSAAKPKAHGRTSPGSSGPSLAPSRLSIDDSGEELAQERLQRALVPRWPRPKASGSAADPSSNIVSDSGEDSPDRPGGFAVPSAQSPFLAFGATKNASPFA